MSYKVTVEATCSICGASLGSWEGNGHHTGAYLPKFGRVLDNYGCVLCNTCMDDLLDVALERKRKIEDEKSALTAPLSD